MKRIISFILAVFLLVSAAAFAEMGVATQMNNEAVFNQAVALLQFYHQPESIRQAKSMFSNLPGSYNQATYYEIYAQIMLDLNDGLYENALGQLEEFRELIGYAAFETALQENYLPSCEALYIYTQARQAEAEMRYADAYALYKKTDFMDAAERVIALRDYKATPTPAPTDAPTPEPTPTMYVTPTPEPTPTPAATQTIYTYPYIFEVYNGECTFVRFDCEDVAAWITPEEVDGYPLTAIANNAFYEYDTLEEIILSSSITSIGNNAFYGCDSFCYIHIPNSVTFIGENAFFGCYYLTIYCEAGSYAEAYAIENGLDYLLI